MSNTQQLDEAIEGLFDVLDLVADLDDQGIVATGRQLLALRSKVATAVDGSERIIGEALAATPDDTGRVFKRLHERFNQLREKVKA